MPYEIAPTSSFATDEHVQEHLEGLLEDGHDEDEMKEFIETHGNSDFMCYYEDYVRMVGEYDQETVDAFLEEYEDFKLHDEINIGCYVEEDDLPDEIEEDSWIDGLLTSGFHAVNDDELFGEEITGYSLY